MKVLIFGGRDFNDYKLLETKCDEILKNVNEEITIIEGDALGADKLDARYAIARRYKLSVMPAKWNDLTEEPCKIKYNKNNKPYNALAGFNRNARMILITDIAIGFWDGTSRGTKNSIDLCKEKGIPLYVINY